MSVELVRELNDRAGCGLEITGVIDRGQSGAAYVQWPDGRNSVVTTAFTTLAHMEQTAEVLDQIRTLDIPVPRHEYLLEVQPGTVAVVQERLPGTPRTVADLDTIQAVLIMNDRFAGLPQLALCKPALGHGGGIPDPPGSGRVQAC